MTPEQIELARHALGLPNRNKKSYRNHFVAGEGHSDFENWRDMVEKGFARGKKGSQLTGGDPVFWLTLAGASLALRRGEKLDPDDFNLPSQRTVSDVGTVGTP
jgi:hypothetical protein